MGHGVHVIPFPMTAAIGGFHIPARTCLGSPVVLSVRATRVARTASTRARRTRHVGHVEGVLDGGMGIRSAGVTALEPGVTVRIVTRRVTRRCHRVTRDMLVPHSETDSQ